METDVAGLMALRILNTFQAMHAQCPAVANASSAASPAFSPNLLLKIAMKLAEKYERGKAKSLLDGEI